MDCSYDSNFTCISNKNTTSNDLNGWPIIVKNRQWKTSKVVGFITLQEPIFIDTKAKNWIAKTLSKSIDVEDMPSCRGSGIYVLH